MLLPKFFAFASCTLASALLLPACKPAAKTSIVRVDGSSTVYPVTEAVAEAFLKETGGRIRVTVGIAGTGGGFKKFSRGESDITNASRPILAEEIAACKQAGIEFIELPICFDALTVAVHPQNSFVDHLTVAELKKIWEPAAQGKITSWAQVRPGFPDEPLKLFGAGSDSGTFDYFTEAIVGKAKACRSDFTASEDDNTLVQGIESDKFALGFIPYAYFEPHATRMKAVAVDAGNGDGPVFPSSETVVSGKYTPLSRPLFIYVSRASADKPEVAEFIAFYLSRVGELAKEVKYTPLPDSAYQRALERFKNKETGTVFGGHPEVGLTVEALLERELK